MTIQPLADAVVSAVYTLLFPAAVFVGLLLLIAAFGVALIPAWALTRRGTRRPA